ncbi:hypothetical protein ANCCAN_28446, partial [Ancylostoma caninum]
LISDLTTHICCSGLVYDVTQSYSAAFFFAGFVIVVSGLISCAIPFVHKWKRSHGDNEGDDTKDMDNASGKLSVLTERSEENLTEYQRTIQSLRQQHALLQVLDFIPDCIIAITPGDLGEVQVYLSI